MHYTYQREYVKCGKPRCRTCPHGPYWYGYRHVHGKMHKRYFGKADPRGPQAEHAEQARAAGDPREAIFNRRTATETLARNILGVRPNTLWPEIERAYKALVLVHHPDRGGNTREFQYIGAAFSFLKEMRSS